MKTILILEDEPAVMGIMRIALKDYRILEARSAEEALWLFIDQVGQIDLLIADVILPAGSGIQVALLLRGAKPGLPIVLMSGYPPNMWNDQDCFDLGRLGKYCVTILQKPFSPAKLANSAQALLVEKSHQMS